MSVRGKFRLVESTQVDWNKDARKLKFQAMCNDVTEKKLKFHKATPTGEIAMTVDNPSAVEQFEIGKSYYVDFSPA